MNNQQLVAVSSRSFSKHPILREKLRSHFSAVKFNESGEKLEGTALIEFMRGASHAIIGLELIDHAFLSALPNLQIICKMGTGTDKVDSKALREHDVEFFHTPNVNKRSVSELVLALIFTLYRYLPQVNKAVHQGHWLQLKGNLLTGKVIGIIGYGAIGRDLSELLAAFQCKCLIYDLYQQNDLLSHVQQVDLHYLLSMADIISLHIPYTKENKHLINRDKIASIKSEAILINTARGGLIDEKALYVALKDKRIRAAALDVFEMEPLLSSELLKLDNFFATSHIGGSTEEAILSMGLKAIENLVTEKPRLVEEEHV